VAMMMQICSRRSFHVKYLVIKVCDRWNVQPKMVFYCGCYVVRKTRFWSLRVHIYMTDTMMKIVL
jgi:hypothetical protein